MPEAKEKKSYIRFQELRQEPGTQIELPELAENDERINPYGNYSPAEYHQLKKETKIILKHANDPAFLKTLTPEQKQALNDFIADYKDFLENEKHANAS